ncbi:MAG: hypothetical protein FWF71_06620 [Actinomycetia bacterium]|nr:hypothetical protein [Actinomycetes bacterium]
MRKCYAFNPVDYDELKDPKPRPIGLTEKAATEYLREHGYDVASLVKAS